MSFFASSSVEYERLRNEDGSSGTEDETIYTRYRPTHAPPHNDRKKRNKNHRSLLIRRQHSSSTAGIRMSRDRHKPAVCTRCTFACTSDTFCSCCTGSNDLRLWAKCLPTTSGVIFFLLLVAFPIHFVDLVIIGVSPASYTSSSVDQSFLVFVCFYSAAILTAILSPLSVPLIGFKWTIVLACLGVTIFTLAKCLTTYWDVLVPLASAVNGLTFGAALAAFRSRSMIAAETVSMATENTETTAVTKATVNGDAMVGSKATVAVETASELASRCGPILRSCASAYVCLNGGSIAVSAIFWLALFVPRISHRQMSSSPTTTVDFSESSQNLTSPAVTWQEPVEVTCGSGFRPSLGNEYRPEVEGYHDDAEALAYRKQALIGCFMLCSLGALLLSLAVLESRRSRPLEAEETTSRTFFGRLCRRAGGRLSKALGQMADRNRCFVVLESVFLGSQQLFVYFLYLQAYPACYLDKVDSILVGFTMAAVGLVMSYAVAIVLWRFIGRVKVLLTSFASMTLLIVIIVYSGSMSRAWVIYCVACLWSVCDCCLHIGITGFIGVELVDRQPTSDHSVDPVMSFFTTGHLCGQFIIFLIAGQSLAIAAYVLLGLTAAAACCHLAIEVSIRLAETETRERQGKKITIQMNEAHEVTWLPLSNPMRRVLENDAIVKFDDNDSQAE